MTAAWLERVRRTTPWRCWVRGMQVWIAGAAVIGAGVGTLALGASKAVAGAVAVAGFGIALAGFAPAFGGMVLLLTRNFEMFSAHSTSVAAALVRDLSGLRPPQPFPEPAWPPPQWQPRGNQSTPVDQGGDSTSASGA